MPGYAIEGGEGADQVAPAPVAPERVAPESIIVQPKPGDVKVYIDTDRRSYDIGDTVEIRFRVSEPSYVYIYNQDARGTVRLIFPNRFDRDNHVGAGEHWLPGAGYRFRVEGPGGTEYLQILATRSRVSRLDWSDSMRDPFPLLGDDPLRVKEEVRGFLRVVPEREWSSAWTWFEVGRPSPPPPPRQRTGWVRVNSEPPWVPVYVDGRYLGTTPLREELGVGGHWVEVRADGYRTARRWVYVQPGQLTPVFFQLEPQ
ncbi:PEGA domain protein [Limnochorda pilosa]|uniref:PEGA domain protein n=1 Tax=Limnochorda pilosa TaxID=1555112 RepID=A0A0K2SJC8_LIMPI|nr:PEGA domain protein [Limnochorda pilosa]